MSDKKKDDEKTKKSATELSDKSGKNKPSKTLKAAKSEKTAKAAKTAKSDRPSKTPKVAKTEKNKTPKTVKGQKPAKRTAGLTPMDLYSPPDFPFHNRELSWIDFNSRVLEEAFEKDNPVLERVKFLSITASNLDEFFMVRVAGVMDRMHSKPNVPDESGMTPMEQFDKLSEKIHEFAKKQYSCLHHSIIPALKKNKLRFLKIKDLNKAQKQETDQSCLITSG